MAYNIDLYGNGHSFDQVITDAGAAFIARFEMFVPHWYEDGHWREGPKKGQTKYSIYFGHQEGGDNWPFSRDDRDNLAGTQEQGLEVLKADLESKAKAVRNRLKVRVNTFQFNALVSLIFNYGQGSVDKVNSVFPLLNQELYVAASVGFWECCKITLKDGTVVEKNGLKVRRACEIELFTRKVMRSAR
jgi:GH24 family phage-related lysozyme (muramidase)